MTSFTLNVSTPQHSVAIPEAFQTTLIANLTERLTRENSPPCLLRAPTGSGKTFVLAKTLSNVTAQKKVVWFWFVPFTNLVNQTLDDLVTNATDLTPVQFTQGINQEPQAGQVLISTVQGVSRRAWRLADYDAGGGEQLRTPADFIALVKSQELEVGVVVDEAHIALDEATEFGAFVRWLNPSCLALATATPKSARINNFLASAGLSSFEGFNVARDDVVQARLNKKYIEAVVYQLKDTTAAVADLNRTVLRQAWLRNQYLATQLQGLGIDLTPLLLVQVDNGKDTIEDAERALIDLGIPMPAIGKHSSDEPNPELMDAIANDSSKKVLIFKQSAGTGFNAPRAFVLASLKSVTDTDFAMQFIGRVMRVPRQIRNQYTQANAIPADLNTAYVYLANADAQKGYQSAVEITGQVRSALEGESEKLYRRKTQSGAPVFTNRPVSTPELDPRTPFPGTERPETDEPATAATGSTGVTGGAGGIVGGPGAPLPPIPHPVNNESTTGETGSLFDDLDEVDESSADEEPKKPDPQTAASMEEWQAIMAERGIRVYPVNRDAREVPVALEREVRPTGLNMGDIAERVATRVVITDRQKREAALAARNRLREKERHTELTTGVVKSVQDAFIVVDRNVVAREARVALDRLPQIEPADHKVIVQTLAKRVEGTLNEQIMDAGESVAPDELTRMSRTAAYWLVRQLTGDLEEALYAEIAKEAVTEPAGPLPAAMLFPSSIALEPSHKNLYRVLPPSTDDLATVEQTLVIEDRELLRDTQWQVGNERFMTGRFDSTFSLNSDERAFADALDQASFVAWWFRNPDRKSYSVQLVRGEHRNYFFPDFVVCVEHVDGQTPMARLIETKHDVKDARRKAKHIPQHYGKVLFLTRDSGKLHVVNDDGGLGPEVDLGDLETLRSELQKTAP